MLRAIAPRMPVSGMTVPGCGPTATATGAATAGCSAPAAAAATSARRIRPPRPEPRTWLRATPSAPGCRRTSGEAGARVCSSTGAGAVGAAGAVVPAAGAPPPPSGGRGGRGGRRRGPGGDGLHDVRGEDPPAGPRAAQGAQVDAALLGDP